MRSSNVICLIVLTAISCCPQSPKPRARDLGVPFDGVSGPLNAITDVQGVEVGEKTLISGEGKLVVGKGPVRTGVTAILPRGRHSQDPVFAGWFTENGNGEMTGTTWVEESGFLEGPVMITNTHSVGTVRDAVIAWRIQHGFSGEYPWSLPVVAETYDGYLNDINGFHVTAADAFAALDSARSGAVAEGNVGGGTGMICNEFKGGIGTSSRRLPQKAGGYTVGVLVQCNYGVRDNLRVAGVPVGREIRDGLVWSAKNSEVAPPFSEQQRGKGGIERSDGAPPFAEQSRGQGGSENSAGVPTPDGTHARVAQPSSAVAVAPSFSERERGKDGYEQGSIIVVVATDAPLIPTQLKRLAKRVTLGLGRDGSISGNGSGDIFMAFSTANPHAADPSGPRKLDMLPNDSLDPLFGATVEATEEAVINAMVAAETMTGIDGHRVIALPHDRLRDVLKKYNRLSGNR